MLHNRLQHGRRANTRTNALHAPALLQRAGQASNRTRRASRAVYGHKRQRRAKTCDAT